MPMTVKRAILATAVVMLGPSTGHSLDGCKAKVNAKTGAIEVSAGNVVGVPVWGPTTTTVKFVFSNEAECLDAGGKLKKCNIGDPATDVGTTPPPSCRIHLDDDSSDGICTAFVKKNCANLTAVPGTLGGFLDLHPRRVFVTSAPILGDFGGLAQGDAICQSAADGQNLGGSWTAWLSDSSTNARSRIADSKYVLVDGVTVVADDLADLTDGSIQNSISVTELGTPVGAGMEVWTGTQSSGVAAPDRCADWTASALARLGDLTATNSDWTEDTALANCTLTIARLYCFED